MTVTTIGLAHAVQGLEQVLRSFRPDANPNSWRWQVRQQMAGLRDALIAETGTGADGWTAAREIGALRERNALLARLSALGTEVLERADVAALRDDLRRLVDDVRRHMQRLHDLAYDQVELELGGSE
ncbi:hypothetical protein [Nocardioides mangrovi]|uniref:Uncharacterized protein n=1 Tax=Nocardioides mangrovi TaxID=2874580 RepID=A0ABS7UEG9_9ACTN|nr:hypothetical protein [Nocardioides mangrovi]MBZ5739398.1 hypothetical protein [Nocardioides mangrovi]